MNIIGKQLEQILQDNNNFKDKNTVNNTSFLYIKSFPTDDGKRPLNGSQNTHFSPNLKITPENRQQRRRNRIIPHTNYIISCTLTNSGDLGVTAANVEFFVWNSILDMRSKNINNSKRIYNPDPLVYSVVEDGETEISFIWNSKDFSGVLAISARVSSLSPVDFPRDWESLDSKLDRHSATHMRWYRHM